MLAPVPAVAYHVLRLLLFAALIVGLETGAEANGTTDHRGNGANQMVLLGQTGDGTLMAAQRYGTVGHGQFQDYYFARGRGEAPTQTRLTNKTGEKIVVFFYNPGDRVRAVARRQLRLDINASGTVPADAYYIVAKQDKVLGGVVSEGQINHASVGVFTRRRGGPKGSRELTRGVALSNQTAEHLKVLIYDAGDKVRLVPKETFVLPPDGKATWNGADNDFRYKVFRQAMLDEVLLDGRSAGHTMINIYRAPTRGWGKIAPQPKIADMPYFVDALDLLDLDGAAIEATKRGYALTPEGKLVVMRYLMDVKGPLRMLGPLDLKWLGHDAKQDLSPFDVPFTQTPAVEEVQISNLHAVNERLDVHGDLAVGTDGDGRIRWGYVQKEADMVADSDWVSAEDAVFHVADMSGSPHAAGFRHGVALRMHGPFRAYAYAVHEGGDVVRGTFEPNQNVSDFTAWEAIPGPADARLTGRVAAFNQHDQWASETHEVVVARATDGRVFLTSRTTKTPLIGKTTVTGWSGWEELVTDAHTDIAAYQAHQKIYLVYGTKDGRSKIVEFESRGMNVKKTRDEINHGNKFASPIVLMML